MAWLSGYTYRKKKPVNSTTAGAQTNYQMELLVGESSGASGEEIDCESHCQDFSNDIRFTRADGTTKHDYWVESITGTTPNRLATFQIEVNSIPDSGDVDLYMYYGKSGDDGESNGDTTFQFFDGFDSIWERQGNCLSSTTLEPSIIYESNPQVLTGETNVFKMWYTHGWGTAKRIYYAESTDGLNWTEYGSNPVISTVLSREYVFKHNSTYYLFACNEADTDIRRYHSSDGLSWIDDGIVLSTSASGWDSDYIGNTFVWIEGTNDWKMLYEGRGTVWKIGLATSSNGTSWNKSASNPVISETGSRGGPECHKIGSYYYLWLHGTSSGHLPTDMYRYRSSNLTSWETYPSGSVFPRTETDEGAGSSLGQVSDPSLLEHNGQIYMWYSATTNGSAESGNMHIKLAIADKTFAELIATDENDEGVNTDKWQSTDISLYSISNDRLALEVASPITKCLNSQNNYNNYIMESRQKAKGSSPCEIHSEMIETIATIPVKERTSIRVSDSLVAYINGAYSTGGSGVSDTWYRTIIKVPSSGDAGAYIYTDNLSLIVSKTGTPAYRTAYIALWQGNNNTGYVDWIFIRKNASPEPTWGTSSSEESEPEEGQPTMARWHGIPGMNYTGRGGANW